MLSSPPPPPSAYQHQSRQSRGENAKLSKLLSALSFEDESHLDPPEHPPEAKIMTATSPSSPAPKSKKRKSKQPRKPRKGVVPSRGTTNASGNESTAAAYPDEHASKDCTRRLQQPPERAPCHIWNATLDPDGDVEVVYFDPAQYGEDGLRHDRESVVTSHLLLQRGGGSGRDGVLTDEELRQLGLLDEEFTTASGGSSVTSASTESASSYATAHATPPQQDAAARGGADREPLPPPPPPTELPLRFLRAGKGDPAEGWRRYKATLAWRQQEGVDYMLRNPEYQFDVIKKHYPHYIHLTGREGQVCYYEMPPKTNLKALKAHGVSLDALLRHYAMVTEFLWQYVDRDDLARSIYIIDLEGIRFGDFVGDVVDFVKKASALSSQHYPERAGYVYVINVPIWFKAIWNVVKPWIDPVTLDKIKILRGADEIRRVMEERIPIENLPPEYGGKSMPLGQSPEEKALAAMVRYNNARAWAEQNGTPPPPDDSGYEFNKWNPARSY